MNTASALSATAEMIRHGSAEHRLNTAPLMGWRYETPRVAIELVPARPFEVNFTTPQDVVSIAIGAIDGKRAHDSDKVRPVNVTPGALHFHPAGSSTYFLSHKTHGEILIMTLDASMRREIAEEFGGADAAVGVEEVFENMTAPGAVALALAARRFFLSGQLGGAIEAESLGVLALGEAMHAISAQMGGALAPGGLDATRLGVAFDMIEESLEDGFNLADLADAVGLTMFHFARSFKQSTGLSPHQYILERRLVRAREKLTGTNDALVEIAYAAGFSSQAHMTDVFKKHLGVTPGRYRDDIRR